MFLCLYVGKFNVLYPKYPSVLHISGWNFASDLPKPHGQFLNFDVLFLHEG